MSERTWRTSRGYRQPLYLLPFDHRHSYETQMFGLAPPLTPEQRHRIADSKQPLEPSPPQGIETLVQPLAQARIHQYLSMALPLLFTRQQDGFGALGLALNATEEPNGYHREELDQIRELLVAARDLWVSIPDTAKEDQRAVTRAAVRLIQIADTVAVTTV